MTQVPEFQLLWTLFDLHVRRPFGASVPRNKETGCANAQAVIAQSLRQCTNDGKLKYPHVIYETEFCHDDYEWLPCHKSLTGVAREEEFLRKVEWFFEDFCRSEEHVLAGIEEPRLVARKFSPVNPFTIDDNIKFDIERGDLYAGNSITGEWNQIFSELWICSSTQFSALSRVMNNPFNRAPNAVGETGKRNGNSTPKRYRPRTNTNTSQKRCEKWLAGYAAGYEKGLKKHIPNSRLKAIATDKFKISGKAFDRAWHNVAAEFPRLSKPGRRY